MRNTGICLVAIILGTLGLAGCSHESSDWKSASAADTAEAYQQFLQQHPKSANAAQAQARIQQIAEDRDWQGAAAADTRDAYQQFIAQHPDSKWAQEARIRIENFAQAGAAPAAGHATTASAASAAAANPAPGPTPGARHAHASAGKLASTGERHHFVQLGAFHSKARAESEWKMLSAKYPAELKSLTPHFVPGKSRSGPVYKLRVGVSSESDAKGLCGRLKQHSLICVPVTA
jgi:outer membrane murein-binding lipoprotein Lpp